MDWQGDLNKRLIIDNGSHNMRCGKSSELEPSLCIENIIALCKKTGAHLLGKNIDNIFDESAYSYIKPLCRGMIVNFHSEIELWEEIFNELAFLDQKRELNPYSLTLTIQLFTPPKIKERIFEIIYEYFAFGAFLPVNPQIAIQKYAVEGVFKNKIGKEFQVVLESSHSASYSVPIFDNEIINYSVKRLDVGGKLLTNKLKEVVSLRYLDMKNEYRLLTSMKEQMCYVSKSFIKDIRAPDSEFKRYYVLPDADIYKKGYPTDTIEGKSAYSQWIALSKERFAIPETIFNPADIGLNQAGLVETVIQSINDCNNELKNNFYDNIILCGGNSFFGNLESRLLDELTQATPEYISPKIFFLNDLNATYKGCKMMTEELSFTENAISKAEYKELGIERLMKMYLV